MELLLEAGAPVDARDSHGETPIIVAVAKNLTAAARQLIHRGADLDVKTQAGGTPLHIAAAQRSSGILQLLLEAGARADAITDPAAETALHLAAARGDLGCVRLLLGAGAPIDALDAKQQAPLHVSHPESVEVLDVLLEAGAESDAESEYGTPLELALLEGHVKKAELLAERGARPERPEIEKVRLEKEKERELAKHERSFSSRYR